MKRALAILLFILLVGCTAKTAPVAPPSITATHGQYQTTDCDTIIDSATGLEWKIGPDQVMGFDVAKRWVEKLRTCTGRCCDKAWRLPKPEDLATLYQGNKEGMPFAIPDQFKKLAGGEKWILWADGKESSTAGRILSNKKISGSSISGTTVGVAITPRQSALKRPVAVRSAP